jgi:hypothetical protein
MYRIIILLMTVSTILAGVSLAQTDPGGVETAPPVANADAGTSLAIQAGRAQAVAQLALRARDLPVGEGETLGDYLGKTWPAMLAAMAIDPITAPGEVGASITVAASRDDFLRWVGQARKSPHANDALKMLSLKEAEWPETVSVSVDARIPASLQLPPLLTKATMKVSAPQLWEKHVVGQGRLLAERQAHGNALQRLADRSREIRVTDSLRVEDFVAGSDEPDVDMRQFLRGATSLGVRFRKDALILEVFLQGSRRAMLASFINWADDHYQGDRQHLIDLRRAVELGEDRLFSERGTAMPPRETIRGLEPEDIVRLEAVVGKAVPMWATAEFTAGAEAKDPSAGVLSRDALAGLLGQAWQVPAGPESTLGDLAIRHEVVLRGLMLAATMRREASLTAQETGMVTVDAVMPMLPAWRTMAGHILENGLIAGMALAETVPEKPSPTE